MQQLFERLDAEAVARKSADTAGATFKLSWKLQDGPGVGELINLR